MVTGLPKDLEQVRLCFEGGTLLEREAGEALQLLYQPEADDPQMLPNPGVFDPTELEGCRDPVLGQQPSMI